MLLCAFKEQPSSAGHVPEGKDGKFNINFEQSFLMQTFKFFLYPQEAPIEEKDAPGNFISWLISR